MNPPPFSNLQREQIISSMEFDNLLREETRRLTEFVTTLGNEELRPMLMVFLEGQEPGMGRKRALMPVAAMKEGEGKRQVMMSLGAATAQQGLRAVAALLISEGWAKHLDEAEAWRMKTQPVRPSQAPDRQERLIVMGRTVDRRASSAMAPIHRDGSGTRLGEWEIHPCKPLSEQDQDNLLGEFWLGFLVEWARRKQGR